MERKQPLSTMFCDAQIVKCVAGFLYGFMKDSSKNEKLDEARYVYSNPDNKRRIPFIDFIKGICIILLVSFHIKPSGHELHQTFLMPIFFFVSGLNFKTYNNFNYFFRRKVNRLIVPFVFFLILGALYCFGRNLLESHFNISVAFERMPLNPVANNTPMWFLFVLFIINMIYYVLVRYLPRALVIVLSILIGGVGYCIAKQGYVLEPYLDMAFVALPFFMLGSESGKLGLLNQKPPLIITFTLVVASVLWVCFDTPVINMLRRNYPSALQMFGLTTMVIFSLLFVCQYINRKIPIISYLGRYSLIVLGTHYFLIGIIRIIARKFFGEDETLVWFSVLIVTLAVEFPVIYLLRKYLPRFTAQKEFFHEGWKLKK